MLSPPPKQPPYADPSRSDHFDDCNYDGGSDDKAGLSSHHQHNGGEWKKYTTNDFNSYTYYFNERTGESSWDTPPNYESPPGSPIVPSSPPELTSSPPSELVAKPKSQPSSFISATSNNGQTPLHIVSSKCSIQGMQLLLANGADANALDANGNTSLHRICENEKAKGAGGASALPMLDCVNLLLEHGVNVNQQNDKGDTALHLAVKHGHDTIVEGLAFHSSCDLGILDGKGQNALHLSAVVGELGCMQMIVMAGQSGQSDQIGYKSEKSKQSDSSRQEPNVESSWVPCTTEHGSTYYYNTVTGDSSWEVGESQSQPSLHANVKEEEKEEEDDDEEGAEEEKEEEEGKEEKKVASANVEDDNDEDTLVHHSTDYPTKKQRRGTIVTSTLIDDDDDMLSPSSITASPLNQDITEDVESFTDAHDITAADTELPMYDDGTAGEGRQDNAKSSGTHMAIWSKFFQNAMRNRMGLQQINGLVAPNNWGKHLEDHEYFDLLDAAVNDNNGGHNLHDENVKSAALFATVLRGELENVERILLNGAPVMCADKIGRTPLHHACRLGQQSIVAILCDYGADVDCTDSQGNSPLHIAAVKGVEPVLRFLLESAALVHLQNNNGDTPLHLAVWHGNKICVIALLEYGAEVSATNNGALNCFDNVMARSPMAHRMPNALHKTMSYIDELLIRKGVRTMSSLPLREPNMTSGDTRGSRRGSGSPPSMAIVQEGRMSRHEKAFTSSPSVGIDDGVFAHQLQLQRPPVEFAEMGDSWNANRNDMGSLGGGSVSGRRRGVLPPQRQPQLQLGYQQQQQQQQQQQRHQQVPQRQYKQQRQYQQQQYQQQQYQQQQYQQQQYRMLGSSMRSRSPMSETASLNSFEDYPGGDHHLPPPPPPPLLRSSKSNPGAGMGGGFRNDSNSGSYGGGGKAYHHHNRYTPPMHVVGDRNSPSNSTSSPTNNSSSDDGGVVGNGNGVWGAVTTGASNLFGKFFSPTQQQQQQQQQLQSMQEEMDIHDRIHDVSDTLSQSSFNSRGSGSFASISSMLPPPPPPPPRSPPIAPPPTADKYLRGSNSGDGVGVLKPIPLSQPPLDVQVQLALQRQSEVTRQQQVPEDVRKALEVKKMREARERNDGNYMSMNAGGKKLDVRQRYLDVFGSGSNDGIGRSGT